jgi:hypothetical protein
VYEETLAFLGLPWDGRHSFPRVNASKRSRLAWLARAQAAFVQSLPRSVIQTGRRVGLGRLNKALLGLNSQPHAPAPLRDEFRRELIEEFDDDINLLSELIGRNLDDWKQRPTTSGVTTALC